MPNLVGIGNSQVPTNAMLGALAYQDSIGDIDIERIKARIPDTAADVFVYDTRKDSDGGAWRKKATTQSWYNEGASETRGARKEFPAVAVIVVEDGGTYQPVITIYDGDDPNLPMWMVFKTRNAAGGNDQRTSVSYYAAGPYPIRKVAMLNGVMVDCQYRSAGHAAGTVKGVTRYNFINDSSTMMTDEGDFRRNGNLGDERNTERSYTKLSSVKIVHTQCNDVAVTVLPNAPIDSSTGLPIITIAVGTDGGMTVIKDDGVAADFTGFNPVSFVAIEGNTVVGALGDVTTHDFIFKTDVPLAGDEQFDAQITASSGNLYANSNSGATPLLRDINMTSMALNPDGTIYRGGSNGFDIIAKTETVSGTVHNSLISYIDTDYNSGYLIGNIRTAHLSSTDTTNLDRSDASNLIIYNGTDYGHFDSDHTSGWSLSGAATPSISGGKLVYSGSGAGFAQRAQSPAVITTGLTYTIKFTVSDYSSGTVQARTGNSPYGPTVSANGTYHHTIRAGSTPTETVLFYGNSFNGKVDDVEIYIQDQDRSTVLNQGLQAFGTIEKQIVAAGAELVSYRPNSSSLGDNYFRLPLTSSIFDLTGEWSITFWAKKNGNTAQNYSGWEIAPDDISSNNAYSIIAVSMYFDIAGVCGLRGMNGGANQDAPSNPFSAEGFWRCVSVVQRGGTTYFYIDGELVNSGSVTYTNPSSAYSLYIFGWSYSSTRYYGRRHIDFSLFRMSESALTVEQVKKLYHDERHLFQKNAKCTLSGATSAVTALAYDDTTNILHVGTSSGRSDFRGLARINNTTTAVTTAISASDGLVAEQ